MKKAGTNKTGTKKTGGNGRGTPVKTMNKKQTEAATPKKYGVCAFIAERLKAKDETQVILDAIHEKFPMSKATGKDVSIIRSKINRGII